MDYVLFIMLAVVLYILLTQQGLIPGTSFFKRKGRSVILDSCALIDGRIVELVRTGFVADELIIPKFILSELQLLADGNDSHKRERARFGLEVAAELQEYVWAQVKIDDSTFAEIVATDDKLVELAKKRRGVLCTTDYNLNKVAAVEGIRTLNVNELSQALRPVTLPGEKLQVKVVQRGSNPEQGVGYLEDGTMIVIDGGAKALGATVEVDVDRMHQTVAGKMVFAHVRKSSVPAAKPKQRHSSPEPSRKYRALERSSPARKTIKRI